MEEEEPKHLHCSPTTVFLSSTLTLPFLFIAHIQFSLLINTLPTWVPLLTLILGIPLLSFLSTLPPLIVATGGSPTALSATLKAKEFKILLAYHAFASFLLLVMCLNFVSMYMSPPITCFLNIVLMLVVVAYTIAPRYASILEGVCEESEDERAWIGSGFFFILHLTFAIWELWYTSMEDPWIWRIYEPLPPVSHLAWAIFPLQLVVVSLGMLLHLGLNTNCLQHPNGGIVVDLDDPPQ